MENQRHEMIDELRDLINEVSDRVAQISRIAEEIGDDYTRRTTIATLEILTEQGDWHTGERQTLWSWLQSLEEADDEDADEVEEDWENQ